MKLSVQSIITNKYVLYLISFLSLLQLFMYIYHNNLDAIIVFILISYVTYTFTNNMTLIFLTPLLILRVTSLFSIEGFEENNKNTKSGSKETDDKSTERKKITSGDQSNELIDLVSADETDHTTTTQPTVVDAFSKNTKKTTTKNSKKIENYDNSNLASSMSSYDTPSSQSKETSNKSNTNKDNNKPNLHEDDSKDPTQINYASTLHSNLKYYNDLLGKDGISKMSAHTKDLLDQQAQLGKSIEQFAPLMEKLVPFVTQASTALNNLNINQPPPPPK